jgi:tetratricopeptide (TPR) repeat protein
MPNLLSQGEPDSHHTSLPVKRGLFSSDQASAAQATQIAPLNVREEETSQQNSAAKKRKKQQEVEQILKETDELAGCAPMNFQEQKSLLTAYHKLFELEPTKHTEYYFKAASAYKRLNDPAASILHFMKYLLLVSSYEEVGYFHREFLADWHSYISDYLKELKFDDQIITSSCAIALIRRTQGEYAFAIGYLKGIVKLPCFELDIAEPFRSYVWFVLADSYFQLDSYQESINCLEKIVMTNVFDRFIKDRIYYIKAECLFRQSQSKENMEEALTHITEAIYCQGLPDIVIRTNDTWFTYYELRVRVKLELLKVKKTLSAFWSLEDDISEMGRLRPDDQKVVSLYAEVTKMRQSLSVVGPTLFSSQWPRVNIGGGPRSAFMKLGSSLAS